MSRKKRKNQNSAAPAPASAKASARGRKMVFVSGDIVNSLYGYGLHGAAQWRPEDVSWYAPAGSPGQDIDENLEILRARSRDVFMSSGLLSAILLTLRDGVVGRGLRFASQIDETALGMSAEAAADWEKRTERLFSEWCSRAGINGESLNELAASAYFGAILSGDAFAVVSIGDRGPRVRVIEGDCVRTPAEKNGDLSIKAGIQFSPRGRRIGAYFGGYASDGAEAWRFVPAFTPARGGALQIHAAYERPGQVRGIPIVSRVLGSMKQLDRYVDAEVSAAVVSAKFTVAVMHTDSGSLDEPEAAETPIALGNGAIIDLEPGADVKPINPARPFGGFGAFYDAMSLQICAALGLPWEIVTKKFDSSYSASRAALLDAQKTFEIERARLIRAFMRPIFSAWLEWAIGAGVISAPGFFESETARDAWSQCAFYGEAVPALDPVKEAQAAAARVDAFISTREAEALAAGESFDIILRKRAREEKALRAAGLIYDQNHRPIEDSSGGDSQKKEE